MTPVTVRDARPDDAAAIERVARAGWAETYRGIFEGISHLFEMTATLPVDLLPTSETAVIYRDKLLRGIEELITIPVAEGLPPKLLDECPPMPVERPERPQR